MAIARSHFFAIYPRFDFIVFGTYFKELNTRVPGFGSGNGWRLPGPIFLLSIPGLISLKENFWPSLHDLITEVLLSNKKKDLL